MEGREGMGIKDVVGVVEEGGGVVILGEGGMRSRGWVMKM